jgi:hypothetical protein
MGTITDSKGNIVGKYVDTLGDWKQAAEVEAGARREFQIANRQLREILESVLEAYNEGCPIPKLLVEKIEAALAE